MDPPKVTFPFVRFISPISPWRRELFPDLCGEEKEEKKEISAQVCGDWGNKGEARTHPTAPTIATN